LIQRRLRNDRKIIQMINMLRRAAMQRILMAGAIAVVATPSFAQQPTDAQRSAIRSACRSDYMAHCASVPPGRVESLQCLRKNMSSLSSSCQRTVNAIEAPAAPAAEKSQAPAAVPKAEAPAATEPAKSTESATPPAPAAKAAASPSPKKPSSAQVSAIRSACRSDYQKSCAGVPTGGAAALSCLEKHSSQLSQGCQQAVTAASGASTAGAPATGPAAAAPAAATVPVQPLVLRRMLPREELFVARTCGADIGALCGGVPAGGGRIMRCLATQLASLSPACSDVLTRFSASQ
jgi:cysteine rich repeat protein